MKVFACRSNVAGEIGIHFPTNLMRARANRTEVSSDDKPDANPWGSNGPDGWLVTCNGLAIRRFYFPTTDCTRRTPTGDSEAIERTCRSHVQDPKIPPVVPPGQCGLVTNGPVGHLEKSFEWHRSARSSNSLVLCPYVLTRVAIRYVFASQRRGSLEQERENGMRTPPSQARGTRRHGTVFYVAMSDREFCQQTNGSIKGDTYREGTGQQVVGVPGTFPGYMMRHWYRWLAIMHCSRQKNLKVILLRWDHEFALLGCHPKRPGDDSGQDAKRGMREQ
ncbi:hypothetical protein DFH94DRAFT_685807 [Russula ochroleuca]|uniref:Uncharacterized protein n=1 Tax=Russula ochroleuca TaxID=152965 RepID=A0A9P5JXQ3_9AGAM|nr:hypothetical protein DFH94DRAFT_685807 [Russula ochroleuca]